MRNGQRHQSDLQTQAKSRNYRPCKLHSPLLGYLGRADRAAPNRPARLHAPQIGPLFRAHFNRHGPMLVPARPVTCPLPTAAQIVSCPLQTPAFRAPIAFLLTLANPRIYWGGSISRIYTKRGRDRARIPAVVCARFPPPRLTAEGGKTRFAAVRFRAHRRRYKQQRPTAPGYRGGRTYRRSRRGGFGYWKGG